MLAALAWVAALLCPTLASAGTLQEAMDELARDLSRGLRRYGVESVTVDRVDAPFPDGSAPYVRDAFVAALREVGMDVVGAPAEFTVSLAYERGPGNGAYTFRARVKDDENQSVGEFVRPATLDDPTDRTVLEALSFDATTLPGGGPRVATRVEIESAVAEAGTVVVETDHVAEPPAGAEREAAGVRVEVGRDGRVTIITDESRIVVDPRGAGPGDSIPPSPPDASDPGHGRGTPPTPAPARLRGSRWERYCPKPSHRVRRHDP